MKKTSLIGLLLVIVIFLTAITPVQSHSVEIFFFSHG